MTKRLIALVLAALMLFSFAACGSAKEQTFSTEELSIKLNDSFKATDYTGYTKCFENQDTAIFVLREDKSLLGGVTITLDEYAQLCRKSNEGRNPGEITKDGSIPVFEYDFTNPDTKVNYHYYTTMHESEKAFWLVQFVCEASKFSGRKAEFSSWSKTISFK